ncbi:MAG: type II toxin-antitoxin system death-on-curing family toxin [Thermoleophilaceae bacterium]|nr:type II toxin-antitoxin system death-on-curing family toxin [Thermoleophilaceae bacterium]
MWRPDLGDYLAAAAVVLETPVERLERLPRLDLAESALAAPFAGFGGEEAYPLLEEKAAVLLDHLARNHPLPDGNKRTAFLVMVDFLENNGRPFGSPDPDVDHPQVERVAAGEADLEEITAWVRRRMEPR